MALKKSTGGFGTTATQMLVAAIGDVAAVMANAGIKYTSNEIARNIISLEEINIPDLVATERTFSSLVQDLRSTSLATVLLKSCKEEQLTASLEAAAYTLLAGSDAGMFMANAAKKVNNVFEGKGFVVLPNDSDETFSLESFDPVSAAKYLAATAVANAQATVAGNFEEVWFPQQLVPAGQNGVDVQIVIPKIFTTKARSTDGTVFDLNKKSIIEAILTPDLLESEATTVLPYASSATLPADLVPASDIPTINHLIDGITVPTRPILFNREIDVIGISNAPGLIKVGVFDETDSLDPIINIGTVYYKLTINVGSGSDIVTYLKSDVSSQIGTLLTQVQAGLGQALQTTASTSVFISPSITPVNGADTATVVAAIESILGIAAGTKFNIVANIKMSATANTELGNITVNLNSASISHIYDINNVVQPLTPLVAPGVVFTVTPVGYLPQLRRTNSNLRQNGTIIDNNTLVTYRFPVNQSAPIISQAPIGASNNVTLEGLAHAARIRQNGRAVKALAALEAALESSNGIPAQSPIMGAEFVTPWYRREQLDVRAMVSTMNSADNLANLRGQILAAMTNMVNQALLKSHYMAALEATTGDPTAFEIIVVTDPQIAPHLWEPGDIRSFGDSRKFNITQSNNTFFSGKIYFSFRRSGGGDEIHPLDFGRMLITPPLTYDVVINRNGRTVNEVHTVPRVNSYATLPILMRLDLEGLADIYTQIQ